MSDTNWYYDCKKNFFDSQEQAVAWYVAKYGILPQLIITTSTGWMVGPVPEKDGDE